MGNQTAPEIVALMEKKFARWGIPDEIVTDSGKNYDSAEFSQFCQGKKTEHTKSSPQHHQSNGKSGSAVKIANSLLPKFQKTALNPYEALLDQRNIPTVGMTTSPTQRFLNRRTRTEIPMKGTLLTPKIAEKVLEEQTNKTKISQFYYDRTAKDLNEVKRGDKVRVNPEGLVKGQEWKKGCVVKNHGYRSYAVEVDGKFLRRNRVHLKQDNQNTESNLTSDTRKFKEQREVPARQNIKVKPTRQITKITDPSKCSKKMELITAKRTRLGRLVKTPRRYSE